MKITDEDKLKLKELILEFESVDYAFLFGSALKQMRPDSDVDILISGKLTFDTRTDMAGQLEQIIKRQVDVVQVDKATSGLVLTALSKGESLFIRDKERLKEDYFRSFYRYEDEWELRKLQKEKIKQRAQDGSRRNFNKSH